MKRYEVFAWDEKGQMIRHLDNLFAGNEADACYIAAHYWGLESRPNMTFEAYPVGCATCGG